MMQLKILSGNEQGRLINLGYGTIVLGSDEQNQIVINGEKATSRHAELTFNPDGVTISTLSGSNNAFINEVPLTLPHHLQASDVLRIGRVQLQLSLQVPGFSQASMYPPSSNSPTYPSPPPQPYGQYTPPPQVYPYPAPVGYGQPMIIAPPPPTKNHGRFVISLIFGIGLVVIPFLPNNLIAGFFSLSAYSNALLAGIVIIILSIVGLATGERALGWAIFAFFLLFDIWLTFYMIDHFKWRTVRPEDYQIFLLALAGIFGVLSGLDAALRGQKPTNLTVINPTPPTEKS
jgi:Inner membrane component of T3SS, cytoplasmic domain